MIVLISLATAFVVFAVQVQVIGEDVRRHEAEVRTGAAAVLRVDGEPAAVIEALDQIDPGRGAGNPTLTAVVVTRRADASATRGMFIEPDAFDDVAFGADRAADRDVWLSLRAPTIRPIVFTGDAVVATIGAHPNLGHATDEVGANGAASQADLGVVYLTADATRHTLALGTVQLDGNDGQQLRRDVACEPGCRLLQITLAPNGAMRGPLPITGLHGDDSSMAQPVGLGRGEDWQAVPSPNPDADVTVRQGTPGLLFAVSSGGGQVAAQYAWAPAVLPVLAAADMAPQVNPVVAAPDGSPLPIEAVHTARDAIPRQLHGVAIGDLTSVLRRGPAAAGSQTTIEVWVSESAVEGLPAIIDALAGHGLSVIATDTVQARLADQRITAAALTGAIAPVLAGLAMALATFGVALTLAGQRSGLTRDLAALRLAGLSGTELRRAVIPVFLAPALAAVLVGALCGSVGCVLVIGGLPLLPNASPAIHPNLGLHPIALAACLVGWLVLIMVVVQVCAARLLTGSRVDRLRTPR